MNLKKLYFSIFSFIAYTTAYTSSVETISEIPLLSRAVGLTMPNSTLDDKLETIRNQISNLTSEMIKATFTQEDIGKLSDKIVVSEDCLDADLISTMHVAALWGDAYAQEKWSDYLLSDKQYSLAAYWFLESSKNGNPDTIAYLYNKNLFDVTSLVDLRDIQNNELRHKLVHHWQNIYAE